MDHATLHALLDDLIFTWENEVVEFKQANRITTPTSRKPNYHVSADVAQVTHSKADYIRTRAQDDQFYAKLLTDYLLKFGQASRSEISQLLKSKLSDALDDRQKYNKISSLLTKLRRGGVIVNAGTDTAPRWQLAERKPAGS